MEGSGGGRRGEDRAGKGREAWRRVEGREGRLSHQELMTRRTAAARSLVSSELKSFNTVTLNSAHSHHLRGEERETRGRRGDERR